MPNTRDSESTTTCLISRFIPTHNRSGDMQQQRPGSKADLDLADPLTEQSLGDDDKGGPAEASLRAMIANAGLGLGKDGH